MQPAERQAALLHVTLLHLLKDPCHQSALVSLASQALVTSARLEAALCLASFRHFGPGRLVTQAELAKIVDHHNWAGGREIGF
jgi:hypothetical protein